MSSYMRWPATLALALTTSLAVASSSSAQPRPYYDESDSWQRIARNNGYSAGYERGEADARDRVAVNYTRDPEFQRADAGYSRDLTSLERYRREFREGFAMGYSEGYQRYNEMRRDDRMPSSAERVPARIADSPRRPGSMNVAFEYGFADGYKAGLEDIRDRDRFKPTDHGDYRDGDRGYEKRYGEKDTYKTEYRDGFHAGYARGYREGRP